MEGTHAAMSNKLGIVFQNVQLRFNDAYQRETNPFLEKVAMVVPSTTREEVYPLLAELPQLREWVGERVAHNIAAYDYALKNKDFELTVSLDRNDVQDDRFGMFANTTIPMIARQARRKPSLLVRDIMRAGHTAPCYDGQNFFDASHPINKFAGGGISGTQRNYWGSGKALTFDNYADVRAAMMAYKGESGETLGVVPNMLVVPPQLEIIARNIVQADINAPAAINGATQVGSNTNVLKGTAEVVCLPELAGDPTTWYLLDTSWPVKPFLYQSRQEPILTPLVSPSDPNVFRLKKFDFGIDMRGAAGYGLWFLAAKAGA